LPRLPVTKEERIEARKLGSASLILLGSFWLLEHILTYGYLEFELLGHETYGIILIVIGCLVGRSAWKKKGK